MAQVFTVLYPSFENSQNQSTEPQSLAVVQARIVDMISKLSPEEALTVQIENWPAGPVRLTYMKTVSDFDILQARWIELSSLVDGIPDDQLPEGLRKWKFAKGAK